MPMIHYTIFSDIMQVFFRNFHNIFMQSAPTPELRQRLPYLSAPVEKSCSDDSFFAFLFHKNRRWVFHRFQQPDFLQKRNLPKASQFRQVFLLFRQFLFFHNRIFSLWKTRLFCVAVRTDAVGEHIALERFRNADRAVLIQIVFQECDEHTGRCHNGVVQRVCKYLLPSLPFDADAHAVLPVRRPGWNSCPPSKYFF